MKPMFKNATVKPIIFYANFKNRILNVALFIKMNKIRCMMSFLYKY